MSSRSISTRRRSAARTVSQLLRRAIRETSTLRTIAKALGIDHAAIARFASPEHEASITLRDLLAIAVEEIRTNGQATFARRVISLIEDYLRHLEGGKPSRAPLELQALEVATATGEVCGLIQQAVKAKRPPGPGLAKAAIRVVEAGHVISLAKTGSR